MSVRNLTPSGSWVPFAHPSTLQVSTAMTLDSSGDRAAFVIPITKAGNLRKVTVRIGTVTSLTATVRLSLQTIGASGDPDGTPDETATISSPSSDTWSKVTLSADRTVSVGELIGVVVDFSAYTSGSMQIKYGRVWTKENVEATQYSYIDFYNGSSWAKTDLTNPMVVLEYDDATIAYQPNCVPFDLTGSGTTFNSSSTTNRYGNKITFDEDTVIQGIGAVLDTDNACDLKLYDTDFTTVLATATINTTARPITSSCRLAAQFSSPVTLQGGSTYIIAVVPGAGNVTFFRPTVNANGAGDLDILPAGADWYEVTYTSGAWSNNTSSRNPIWPLVSGIDIAASGGNANVLRGSTVAAR